MEMNESIILIIFYVFIFIYAFLTMWMIKIDKKLRTKKKELLKERYPDLTAIDKKYRRVSISRYFEYYFKKLSKFYKAVPVLVFLLIGIMFGCLFSYNELGVFLCIFIAVLLVSLRQLLMPSIKKQYAFWKEYLEKDPDNPLKVILLPPEENIQLYKVVKLRAICGLLSGFYGLFLIVLMYFN